MEERAFVLKTVVLELGSHAWIIQASDSHWFKLNESPTNIIFFPLHFSKNLTPLNLQFTQQPPNLNRIKNPRRTTCRRFMLLPGQGAGGWLPPILEVRLVGTAVLLAIELWIYKRASGGVVQRVRRVENPFPLVQVAASG